MLEGRLLSSESVVGDEEIQHQRYRIHRIREVTRQLRVNVPTSPTPDPNHLLRFYCVGCAKEVSNLINHPVVNLFGSGMVSTGSNMVTKSVYGELFAATSREW